MPAPLRGFFDYLPPAGSDPGPLVPGIRVRAPFGKRMLTGVLVELVDHSDVPQSKLRAATEVLDEAALLGATDLELCHWASDYYQHPVGEQQEDD